MKHHQQDDGGEEGGGGFRLNQLNKMLAKIEQYKNKSKGETPSWEGNSEEPD